MSVPAGLDVVRGQEEDDRRERDHEKALRKKETLEREAADQCRVQNESQTNLNDAKPLPVVDVVCSELVELHCRVVERRSHQPACFATH